MLNKRKLTKSEVEKREGIVKNMVKAKRDLVRNYGKDAEKVMYGRATKLAKSKSPITEENITRMIRDILSSSSRKNG